MNKIAADGRIVADAEIRYTPSDSTPICSFRVASDVGFGDRKTTNWFTCQLWGKRGEALSQHLVKGTQVTVYGTLTLREWQDKDGLKRMSPEIRIDEISLQGGRDSGAQNQSYAPQTAQKSHKPQPTNLDDIDSDPPF